jgi:hypothetical protein
MNVEEFRKLKPEYKDIKGDQLWDAMTDYMLRQQKESEIMKTIMPIWKTHTLRWLYYRKIPNLVMGKPSTDKRVSDKRCSKCKWGINAILAWSFRDANDNCRTTCKCPHCNEDYIAEPNTNFTHKLWKAGKWISGVFWLILDRLHLVRSSISSRYDTFGDETRYVKRWEMNIKTGEISIREMILKNTEYEKAQPLTQEQFEEMIKALSG